MMAANVIDKSELPDFDEETGLLHKVSALTGLVQFGQKRQPHPWCRWVILLIIYYTEKRSKKSNDFN